MKLDGKNTKNYWSKSFENQCFSFLGANFHVCKELQEIFFVETFYSEAFGILVFFFLPKTKISPELHEKLILEVRN